MALVVPDPSKSIQQNAIEPWSKPHYRSQLAELKRAARGPGAPRRAVGRSLGRREAVRDRGDGASFEGVKGFFRWLERKKYKVHVRVFLSRYRGYLTCPECGGARLRREARDVKVGGRTIDVVCAETVREADAFFAGLAAVREGRRDCRQGAARDPQAARVSARRRPRLPDARSAVVDAVGRRVAADQPGDVARLGARRHAVRPGRALDRPALARQRTADRDPAPAARSGQHRAGRRARRRHDQGRRHRRRHGARRRRAGRARGVLGDAAGAAPGTAIADRQVPARRARDPGAGGPAQAEQPADPDRRGVGAQPQGRGRRDSARDADLRDRRQRVGQEHAGPRRHLRRPQAREGRLGSPGRRRTGSSKARSSSPTSCSSIRRRSAARRARIRSPT